MAILVISSNSSATSEQKVHTDPKMAAIFKIPQFSGQPQTEYISRSYPYMFLYKALVFQAKYLDSSLSSSGYISETNDLRATKLCQRMEHDMSTWGVDVESQR